MEKLKHNYSDVYYSDLDTPTKELDNLEEFLRNNTNITKLALVKVNPKSKELLINNYRGDKNSLIDYAFIKSELAGVGNYNFILEFKNYLKSEEINRIVKKYLNKKFFDNEWVNELIKEDIASSILTTYCDGIWVELYKK